MPWLQVYLPDDLYTQLKARGLPASELLQGAVREELRRRHLLDEADHVVADTVAEHGEPAPADEAWAQKLVAQVVDHLGPGGEGR